MPNSQLYRPNAAIIYQRNDGTSASNNIKNTKEYFLIALNGLKKVLGDGYEKELEYQQLWKAFFHSVSIEARNNPKLQSQNLPKRFWKDIVEFAPTYHQ